MAGNVLDTENMTLNKDRNPGLIHVMNSEPYSLFEGAVEDPEQGVGWRAWWTEDLPTRSGETGVTKQVTFAQR